MTTVTENDTSFFIASPARFIEQDRDTASQWASKYIVKNDALKWLVGKYVEADNANSNGQMWTIGDLRMSQPTLQYSPMNLGHRQNEIVGTFIASELIYPMDESSNPYIETLGAFWKYYFPAELSMVEAAFHSNALSLSMECVSESVTCAGPNGCGETFPYDGPMSPAYCEHIKDRASFRQLNNPHFLAGALIYPPDRPGWKEADVKEFARKADVYQQAKMEEIYKSVAQDFPHLSTDEWEQMMWQIMMQSLLDV